jgi:hypothetical protein
VTRNSVAASVARNKEAHPERYCPVLGCLWALRSGPCRKHGVVGQGEQPLAAAGNEKDVRASAQEGIL